jgi:hypothetical protein
VVWLYIGIHHHSLSFTGCKNATKLDETRVRLGVLMNEHH